MGRPRLAGRGDRDGNTADMGFLVWIQARGGRQGRERPRNRERGLAVVAGYEYRTDRAARFAQTLSLAALAVCDLPVPAHAHWPCLPNVTRDVCVHSRAQSLSL